MQLALAPSVTPKKEAAEVSLSAVKDYTVF
jgi:hypothetical protein